MLGIAGYGTTDRSGATVSSGDLYEAPVAYLSRTSREVKAGDPGGPDTCFGDSGGPLYIDTAAGRRLVGATSRGARADSACDTGTIFSLVPTYATEIEAATGANLGIGTPPSRDAGVDVQADAAVGGASGGGGLAGGCSAAGGSSPCGAPVLAATLVVLAVLRPRGLRRVV